MHDRCAGWNATVPLGLALGISASSCALIDLGIVASGRLFAKKS